MKKRNLVFILALALLMLVAIPATAGPAPAPLPTIETAMPAILTSPARASVAPAMQIAYFEKSPPIFARILASPLIASTSGKTEIYVNAVMATLAALVGLGFAIKANLLKHDIRDRMHGLPRDQDALA